MEGLRAGPDLAERLRVTFEIYGWSFVKQFRLYLVRLWFACVICSKMVAERSVERYEPDRKPR